MKPSNGPKKDMTKYVSKTDIYEALLVKAGFSRAKCYKETDKMWQSTDICAYYRYIDTVVELEITKLNPGAPLTIDDDILGLLHDLREWYEKDWQEKLKAEGKM